jgi:hypothetical protein
MQVPAKKLTEWLRHCEVDQRGAGLKYLLSGRLANEVRDQLQALTDKGWVGELDHHSPALREMSNAQVTQLAGMLDRAEVQRPSPERGPGPGDGGGEERWRQLSPIDFSQRVAFVLNWWRQYRSQLLGEYNGDVYPHGQPPELSADPDELRDNASVRQGWLTLFILGALHTMGRKWEQADRGFISHLSDPRRNWLQRISRPGLRRHEWLDILDEYHADETGHHYYRWMQQFISFYLLGSRLENYAGLYLALRRLNGQHFDLGDVIHPRRSALFQGGTGFDLPSLDSALGFGSCFVLRELIRLGMLPADNPALWPYCYVPHRRVRNLCSVLTGDSISNDAAASYEQSVYIYDSLRRKLPPSADGGAHFDHGFDIPLRLLCERRHKSTLQNLLMLAAESVDELILDVEENP